VFVLSQVRAQHHAKVIINLTTTVKRFRDGADSPLKVTKSQRRGRGQNYSDCERKGRASKEHQPKVQVNTSKNQEKLF
jgi:hypothetical protein